MTTCVGEVVGHVMDGGPDGSILWGTSVPALDSQSNEIYIHPILNDRLRFMLMAFLFFDLKFDRIQIEFGFPLIWMQIGNAGSMPLGLPHSNCPIMESNRNISRPIIGTESEL